jgi:hypothetical protein
MPLMGDPSHASLGALHFSLLTINGLTPFTLFPMKWSNFQLEHVTAHSICCPGRICALGGA